MEDNKTFTQEEVNNIVSKRLSEERAKYNLQVQQKEAEHNAEIKALREKYQKESLHTKMLSALTKANVFEPNEMVRLIKDRVHTDDKGDSYYLTDTGEHLTIEEGVNHWASKNLWAIRNDQKPGVGGRDSDGTSGDPIAKAMKLQRK